MKAQVRISRGLWWEIDLMEMERVFRHMKHMQCEPDAITYSILLEAYRKEGMTDKMYALQQENPSLVPTELVMV